MTKDYFKLTEEENRPYASIDHDFSELIRKAEQSTHIIDVEKIKKAYEIAKYWHKGVKRNSGEHYLYHPLAVCMKLYEDGFRETSVLAAALLHDTIEDTDYTYEQMEKDFEEKKVCSYVQAVTKIEKSSNPLDGNTKANAQLLTDEHFLKLCQAHPFAAYIKFADRWHNLHTCQKQSAESIRDNVNETKAFFIPLARRLGCNKIADELYDACFLAQSESAYNNILKQLDLFSKHSKKGIERTLTHIKRITEGKVELDLKFDMPYPSAIAKEIRSKAPKANLTRPDLFAFYQYKPYAVAYFKILQSTSSNYYKQFLDLCKALVGSKFSIYREEKDPYVQTATVNNVYIEDSYFNHIKLVLITKDEHRKYATGLSSSRVIPDSIAALLPEDKRIRVYTKDGEAKFIEKGASVLDFAFILNTKIGAHFESAFVNDEPVKLDYILSADDCVRINVSPEKTANLSWFVCLNTRTARNRLTNIFERAE